MDNQKKQTFEDYGLASTGCDFDFDFETSDDDINNIITANTPRTASALSSESKSSTSSNTTASTNTSDTTYGSTFSALHTHEATQGTKRKIPNTYIGSEEQRARNRISAKKLREKKKRTLEQNKQDIQSLRETLKALQEENMILRYDNTRLQEKNLALKAAQSSTSLNL